MERLHSDLYHETDAGNMEQLKTLADELKILIHIGSHLNILNVLGAVTQDLESHNNGSMFGHLYRIFLFYCHLP